MRSIDLKKFFRFQLLLLIFGSLLALLWGWQGCLSFLVGAAFMLMGNMLLLSRFFFRKRVFSPLKELMFLYLGEVLKLFVVAVGSVVIAIYMKPVFVIYLAGLVVLQVAIWLMPFFLKKVG